MTISTDGIRNITDADVERINRIRHKNGKKHLPRHEMIEHTISHPAYTDSFDWLEFLTTLEIADASYQDHHEVPHADETDPVHIDVVTGQGGQFAGAGASGSFDAPPANPAPETPQEPSQEPPPAQEPASAPAPDTAPEAPAEAPAYEAPSVDTGSFDSGSSSSFDTGSPGV